MDKYTNLHLHSDASLGDSIIKIPDLITTLEEYEQEYVALTDHGTLMNHYALQQECKGTNIKPIFGNECYCKIGYEKPLDRNRFHLILLAQNEQGLQNIRKLQRISVVNHFYYKPLVPHPLLFENTEGIFVSTACALSYINYNFLHNNDDEAYNFFNKLLDNFGSNNVAIELQYHPTWKDEYGEYPQNFLNDKLIELYVRKKIQSIGYKKSEDDISDTLKSNVLGTSQLSFDLAHESGIDDDNLIQKCIDNTYEIAQKCYFEPKTYDRVIPKFDKHAHFKEIFLKKVV